MQQDEAGGVREQLRIHPLVQAAQVKAHAQEMQAKAQKQSAMWLASAVVLAGMCVGAGLCVLAGKADPVLDMANKAWATVQSFGWARPAVAVATSVAIFVGTIAQLLSAGTISFLKAVLHQ